MFPFVVSAAARSWVVINILPNKYDYCVEAKFTATTGTGTRDVGAGILGRPCTFNFTKQTDATAVPPPAAPAP